jgi:hypothetical protein
MDSDTLTKLLRGEHINVPDRIGRGLWPHPPIRFEQVLVHLTKLIEANEWFPREWHAYGKGEAVDERATIQRTGPTRYLFRMSRAHPANPCLLSQSVENAFTTAQDAANCYLRLSLHLPGDLDGWKVIE